MKKRVMNILIVEPFYGGSHKQWIDDLIRYSCHTYELLSLPGRFWKWRMQCGAITLAQSLSHSDFDLVLFSDMVNVPLFLSLVGAKLATIPKILYFHENQITYPWTNNGNDKSSKVDLGYGFINVTSGIVVDHLFFNSRFHYKEFFEALPPFLNRFPDESGVDVEVLEEKSDVLTLAVDLARFGSPVVWSKKCSDPVVLLWNHRREYDKNPEGFLRLLYTLSERSVDFRLILLGEESDVSHIAFIEIGEKFAEKIVHNGFAESPEHYISLVKSAHFLPVTSIHDFFGVSVLEASACGVIPLLPRHLSYPSIFEPFPELFYKPSRTKQLADLIELYSGMDDLEVLRTKIRAHVLQYDWSNVIKEYDATFLSVAQKNRGLIESLDIQSRSD